MKKKLLLALLVIVLLGLWANFFAQAQAGEVSPPEEPWSNKLLTDTGAADTPQISVGLVITAFDGLDYQDQISQTQNLAITTTLSVAEGEIWLIATDFGAPPDDVAISSVKTDWGYGVWKITGPWQGNLPSSGVAVELVKKTFRIYLPEITTPANEFIEELQDAETTNNSVDILFNAWLNVDTHPFVDERQNFTEQPVLTVVEGEVWLIATDFGAPPDDASITSVKTDWGYGVWKISGPWQGNILNGFGVKLKAP